jgi:hypothetical protein
MGARPQRGADSRRSAAGPRRCERCHAPVIRQLVGNRAALKVTADAEPIPLHEALTLRGPNRLVWCLAELYGGGPQLRWLHMDGAACALAHVIEHECPAGTPLGPKTEGTLW